MSELLEHVDESIARRGLFRRGQSVLVAISGGIDSMVLLHLLHELSRKYSWRLSVAHLNHRLRGRSSDADERLVVRTARKMGLPVITERADVKQVAKDGKLSVEMAARKVRHDFLAHTAMQLKIDTVALAHHADDQVELFFLRLLRGSGSEGLAGMKWKGRSPVSAGVRIVRPLLGQPKAALLEFAAQHKIKFREDASNASLDFQRNRIRHELLPLLRRDYQPALDRTILRVMDIVGAESLALNELVERWLGARGRKPEVRSQKSEVRLPASDFRSLPVAVQRRCIHVQLLRQKVVPDFDLVESLRTRPGHLIKVSADLAVVQEGSGCLRFQVSQIMGAFNPAVCTLDLKAPGGHLAFEGIKFEWRLSSQGLHNSFKAGPGREIFDADKLGTEIVLRHWQAGDRFQPSGMKSAVKLQDLFVNGKVPREERRGLIVAARMDGEIFWVERLRIGERCKLSDTTKHCLQWNWKRL